MQGILLVIFAFLGSRSSGMHFNVKHGKGTAKIGGLRDFLPAPSPNIILKINCRFGCLWHINGQ